MKQNFTIFTIVTLMTFVCVFSFTADYNFIVDNSAMLRLIGIEQSHVLVSYTGEDALSVFDEIGKMDHVIKTIRLSRNAMTLYKDKKEITPALNVCNDYDHLKIKTIIEGRYPIQDNEIAVTGLVLKQLDAKMGDVISIKGIDTKKDFIIVGITQHINNLGKGACITEEGMKRINPEYIPTDLNIYLDKSDKINSVMKAINHKFSDKTIRVSNMDEEFTTVLESFNRAINALCIGCIIITLFIITLVLYLLIRIRMIKERVRLGVSKALGYTTGQLILQIICSFFPVCILGAFVGTIMSLYLINPLLAALLSTVGSIQNCHFTVSPTLSFATFISITAFSVLITAIVAGGSRKITPRELFQ